MKKVIKSTINEVIEDLSNNAYDKFQLTLKDLYPLLEYDDVYFFTEEILKIIDEKYVRNNFADVVKIYEIIFDYNILKDFNLIIQEEGIFRNNLKYTIRGLYSKYFFSLLKVNDTKFNFDLSREVYNYRWLDIKSFFFNKHDTLINFGKYKTSSFTIKDLINIDPQYILWCISSTKYFVLSYDLLTDDRFIKNNKYFFAVEINNLKYELYSYHRHHYVYNKLPYKLPFLFCSGEELDKEIDKLYIELSFIDNPEDNSYDPEVEKMYELIERNEFYLVSYFPEYCKKKYSN